MNRHAAGGESDIFRGRAQVLIRRALERHSEVPISAPELFFAEIDLLDDSCVIGAVLLITEHHALRALEPCTNDVDIGICPDTAPRCFQNRFIDRQVDFGQHQHDVRYGDLIHVFFWLGNGGRPRNHDIVVL